MMGDILFPYSGPRILHISQRHVCINTTKEHLNGRRTSPNKEEDLLGYEESLSLYPAIEKGKRYLLCRRVNFYPCEKAQFLTDDQDPGL